MFEITIKGGQLREPPAAARPIRLSEATHSNTEPGGVKGEGAELVLNLVHVFNDAGGL